jgi:hypothetical protein
VLFNRLGVTLYIDGGKDVNYLPMTGGVTVIDKDYFRISNGTIKIKGPLAVR